jgi:outer membrane receptor for ferrienterochelin and colicin
MPEKKEENAMVGFGKRFAVWTAAISMMLAALFPGFAAEQGTEELMEEISLGDLLNLEITTAGKKAEKISEIPASVVIITREDIETYGYATLAEILENIPGMYKINDYGWDGHDKFGIRGFWNVITNDDIMIFVNGVDQINNVNFNYPLTKIGVPVEAIERIELIRGPMSVIYGSGAFFGVMNIITAPLEKDKLERRISASVGTESTWKLFSKISEWKENYKYSLTASYASTSGIDRPYSEMMDDTSAMPTSGTGDLLEGEEKYFNFSGEFGGFYADMSYIETENEVYLFYPSVEKGSVSTVTSANAVIGYKNKISDKISVDARLGYYRSNQKINYDWFFKDAYVYQELPSSAYDISLNTFITPADNLDITVGLLYRSIADIENMLHTPSTGWGFYYNTTQSLADDEEIKIGAIFSQVGYSPFSSLKLIAGVRLEQMQDYDLKISNADTSIGTPALVTKYNYSQDDVEVIPRFAAIYSLNDNNILKLLYGQATNFPSWFQLQNDRSETAVELKRERIETMELNYIATPSPKFLINASIFYNRLEDLIIRQHGLDEEGLYYSFNSNAGKMETWGAELTVQTNPAENLKIEVSGTWQDTEDKKYPDIEPAYSPDFLGYLKASYRFNKDISLGITGNYVGSMKAAWASNPDGTGARIGEDVSSYFSLGANLRFDDLFAKGLYLNIRGSNLLDEDIRYPATTNNNTLFPKGTLGTGRSFLVTLGWKF